MPQLFTNRARALLTGGITNSATSFVVESAKADLFPTANTGTGSVPAATNWFKVVLQDFSGNVEIVYVRTRTAGSATFSNVIRGQEGTTARAFSAGAVVGLRITALDAENTASLASNSVQLTGDQAIGGIKTFSSDVRFGTNGRYLNYDPATSALRLTNAANSAYVATFANNGDFTAAGNVTAYSDERLKKDWSDLSPDFLDRLAEVKCGTYTRTDSGERQIGVSAQSLLPVVPEGVVGGKYLSVAYGNIALVAVIAMAKELAKIKRKLDDIS
jgi:hypothetical protein